MTKISKCPVCPKLFKSQKYVLSHIARHHVSERVDLLPWKIRTRRRGSNNMALMAAEAPPALAQPSAPPPPMDLVMYDENMAMSFPFKKRMAFIRQVALQNHRYICNICGRGYDKASSLGGHKAQHTKADRKKELKAGEQLVVHVPEQQPRRRRNNGPYQCKDCGKEFSTGQGLGGHRQHCKRHWPLDLMNVHPEM